MEEIDEVGEVDFGFDLASWMDDDYDNEEEEEEEIDPKRSDGGSRNSEPKTSAEVSEIASHVCEIQKPRAPMTPTIRKMLSEAGGDCPPNEATDTIVKQSKVTVSASQRMSVSSSNKVASSAPGTGSRGGKPHANTSETKPGVAQSKLGQGAGRGKPLTKATLNKTQKVPASPQAPPKATMTKKQTQNTPMPKKNAKNVNPGVTITRKEIQAGTKSSTVKTTKAAAVTKTVSSSPASSRQTPVKSQQKSESSPNVPTTTTNTPVAQKTQIKTKTNPAATSTTTTQLKSTQGMKRPLENASHAPQTKSATHVTRQTTQNPVVTSTVSAVTSKPVSSNTTSNTALSSPKYTPSTASQVSNIAPTAPGTKNLAVATAKTTASPKAVVQSSEPATVPVKSAVPSAPAAKNGSTRSVSGSSAPSTGVVAKSLANKTPVSKSEAATTIIKTTSSSRTTTAAAVVRSSVPGSTAQNQAPKVSITQNIAPTVAEVTSTKQAPSLTKIPTSTADITKVTSSPPTKPTATVTETDLREALVNFSFLTSAAVTTSITQTTTATKTSSTPVPNVLKGTTSSTTKPKTTTSKNTEPAKPTTNEDTTSTVSLTSAAGPGIPTKARNSKAGDRAGSPCIAEVMALDVGKDALEDMDLGFTMSMEDIADSTTKITKSPALNKRAISSAGVGSPVKKAKLEVVSPKPMTPVRSKVSSSNNTSDERKNDANLKLDVPSIEKTSHEKVEENPQFQGIQQPLISQSTERMKSSNSKKVSKTTVKRIVHRFHRASQTESKEYNSKLLQCLIRIPALDAPPKSTAAVSVSANLGSGDKQTPFFVLPLPLTVGQDVFTAVSLFNTSLVEARHIQPEVSFTHGISIGHITQAEMDKSLFRENIVSKSSYYNFQFNGEDGVVDLYFKNEETFLTVMTQIRKTKIGPRYLPVTFVKALAKEDQDRDCPQDHARATVVFDQNFSSSAFLAYTKAQVWNKPKVEETFSLHNMPSGIPLDFLKQLFPDAVTIDVEDDPLKFTQAGRRVFLGINRKTGDHVLKLFSQVYINRHCLILTRGRTNATDLPELKEILKKQKDCLKESASLKTLNASGRDINSASAHGPHTKDTPGAKRETSGDGEEVEIVMQVDDVPDAEKILVGRASAWKGPSTLDRLRQAGPVVRRKDEPIGKGGKTVEEGPLQDLSDISDGSDIGENPEEEEINLSTRGFSKSRSVRSCDKSSVSNKEEHSENVTSALTFSSREPSERGSSKSHQPQNVDKFGRNQEIRDKFKTVEERGDNLHVSKAADEQELTPRHDDLRHFIRSHRERDKLGEPGRSGLTTGRIKDPTCKRRDHGDELKAPRSSTAGDDKDTASAGKYSRYSPETEWLLLKRDEEKARHMQRQSKSPSPRQDGRDRFKRLVEERKSPSPRQDGRDRFKRLVAEKMRGLDFAQSSGKRDRDQDEMKSWLSKQRNSSEKERSLEKERQRASHSGKAPLKRKLRSKSPLVRQMRRGRSGSPAPRPRGVTRQELMKGKRREAPGQSKASSPSFNLSGRKVTIVRRKSVSPRRGKCSGRGGSSLSPIRIGDDDDDDSSGVERDRRKRRRNLPEKDTKWLKQPASDTGRRSHSQGSSAGRNNKEETMRELPSQRSPDNSATVASPVDDSEHSTSQLRERLHEFVKHLLDKANISSSQDAAETSRLLTTATTSTTDTAASSNHRELQQKQNYGPGSYLGLSPRGHPAQPEEDLEAAQSEDLHQRSLPPPIPPPILPPLFTPTSENEKISQLESLAKQLAADIQKQQPQEQQQQQQQQWQQQQEYCHHEHQPQLYTQDPQNPLYPQEPPTQVFTQSTNMADGMWAVAPPPLSQPPPALMSIPPPHLVMSTAPPPISFVRQPVVPLPFFTSNMAAQLNLPALGHAAPAQKQETNKSYSDVNLNPHGKFF